PDKTHAELWRPGGYAAIAERASEVAISPSGRKPAIVADGTVYLLEKRCPRPPSGRGPFHGSTPGRAVLDFGRDHADDAPAPGQPANAGQREADVGAGWAHAERGLPHSPPHSGVHVGPGVSLRPHLPRRPLSVPRRG